MEEAGISGCHIEDQRMPKRCGHLDGKELVSADTMLQRIGAAAGARMDGNFLLIARSDARAVEGLGPAIERMKAYVDAGADMIFPEALNSQEEFEAVRSAINVPLLANMTEFGKSRLLNRKELEDLDAMVNNFIEENKVLKVVSVSDACTSDNSGTIGLIRVVAYE